MHLYILSHSYVNSNNSFSHLIYHGRNHVLDIWADVATNVIKELKDLRGIKGIVLSKWKFCH